MSEYLSDQEQKEQILEWWKENGRFIMAGVGLGLVGIFGWRQWNAHLDNQASEASGVFEELVTAVNAQETDTAKQKLDVLKTQYKNTVYLAQAELMLARAAVDAKDIETAISHVEKAIAVSDDNELTELAYFRLARLKLAIQDQTAALSALTKVKNKNYSPLVEEMRGDIYRAQGDINKARVAYETAQTAMKDIPVGDPNLLQMKLSDLGAADTANTKP